jgi:hypothetical protein
MERIGSEPPYDPSTLMMATSPDTTARSLLNDADPVYEVCDIPCKIADLGNACWTVCCYLIDCAYLQF